MTSPKGISGCTAALMVVAIVVILFTALAAQATQTSFVTGGKKGGSYERWGKNLTNLMRAQGIKGAQYQPSKGAQQNVQRVKAGEATVGFTQGDVLMAEGAQGVEIMGALGKECVFVVVNESGIVQDEDDLQSEHDGKAPRIAVGGKGTGSQVSWSYMSKLEDGYKTAAQDYIGGTRALGKLAAGQLDAVMFVTAPGNLNHRLIAAVNGNDKLKFIDIDDSDLNDDLPSGEPVYTFEEVDTKEGWGGGIDTICTQVVAIANVEADEDVLDELSNLFLSNAAAITQ